MVECEALMLCTVSGTQAVRCFDLPAAAAAAHVAALAQLVGAAQGGKPSEGVPQGLAGGPWACTLLEAAEVRLGRYVESRGGRGSSGGQGEMREEDWRAATALFTVGEVGCLLEMYHIAKLPKMIP